MSQTKNTLKATELEAVVVLTTRVMHDYRDPRRGPLELAYNVSGTPDNEESGFIRLGEMARQSQARSFGLAGGPASHGYAGFDHSVARLKRLGFPDEIPVTSIGGPVENTRTEARALVDHVRGMRGDVAIIAPPFHLLRAFVSVVTAIRERDVPLRAYAFSGVALPWGARVTHSQGTLTDTRQGLLAHELERLKRYQAPEYGSLLPASEVLHYLAWRDG